MLGGETFLKFQEQILVVRKITDQVFLRHCKQLPPKIVPDAEKIHSGSEGKKAPDPGSGSSTLLGQ
jgi:hypothetical protein